MPTEKDPFESLDVAALADISGGAARVTARTGAASSNLTTMLTQIGTSIKELAASKNTGGDSSQLMMMMMLMGGLGGGGGAAAPAPAPPPAPIINVSTQTGRKGW